MNLFRSPVIWGIAVAISVALAIAAVKSRRAEPWGFKDLVKNPRGYGQTFGPSEDELRRAVDEAQTWSEEAVAAEVRRFVLNASTAREARAQTHVLLALGPKTHDAVLSLLRDPGLRARLLTPTGENLLPETPFRRVCMLLGEEPPEAAIAALAPFLQADEEDARKNAALVLGQAGSLAAVPSLRMALADVDEYVRSYALIGLNRAFENKRLAPDCAAALFPDLRGMIQAGRNSADAAELLLRLDRERAAEFLLSDAHFDPPSPALHEILEALNEAHVKVPRRKLETLVGALENKPPKHPESFLFRETLVALGRHRAPEDRPRLESLLAHADREVAEGAAAGLLSSHGLDGFEMRIWEKEEKSGYASLSIPQRHHSAVFLCDAEINNGGISQYFFNSSGDRWKDALAGFEAMGFSGRAGILREAIALFGDTAPSEDRETRMDQLSRLYRKNDQIFDALDSRYYESKETLSVGAARYVLRHTEAFR